MGNDENEAEPIADFVSGWGGFGVMFGYPILYICGDSNSIP